MNELTQKKVEEVLKTMYPGGISLMQVMKEVGYGCTLNRVTMDFILQKVGKAMGDGLNETELTHVLSMMMNDGVNNNGWNGELFVESVKELYPRLDWNQVVKGLELITEWDVMDVRAFELLIKMYTKATGDILRFPVSMLWLRWKNVRGQLSLLKFISASPVELFPLMSMNVRRVLTNEQIAMHPAKSLPLSQLTQSWNCLDLIETLIKISEQGDYYYQEVKQVMEVAIRLYPELLVLGLTQLSVTLGWNPLHQESMTSLTMFFLGNHLNSGFVLVRLWTTNPDFVVNCMIATYKADSSRLSRLLDIAQEMKALASILEVKAYPFVIDLAALAARREYLNLEKWVQDRIQHHGPEFISVCVEFLADKIAAMQARSETGQPSRTVPLSSEAVTIFYKVLHNYAGILSLDNAEKLKQIYAIMMQHMNNPTQGNGSKTSPFPYGIQHAFFAGNTNHESEPHEEWIQREFGPEIEAETNTLLEKVYKEEMSVEDTVSLFEKYRSFALDSREREIYDCTINNLYDEYRFFPRYPDKELSITGRLFGTMINRHVLDFYATGVALRYILESLRKPTNSKMHKYFGMEALQRFKARLQEWPQYCSLLSQIPHMKELYPELMEFLDTINLDRTRKEERLANHSYLPPNTAENTDSGSNLAGLGSKETNSVPSFSHVSAGSTESVSLTSLNINTLLFAAEKKQDHFSIPEESIEDRVYFICNNISTSNMEVKVKELLSFFPEKYYRWFAHYIVVKRASIEPNFHNLYASLLETIQSANLYEYILEETYTNIGILLNSDKINTSSSERTLLKNLGTWLGLMTLARNKPILYKDLVLKDLLINAYDNNRLLVIIPFVCKVLEQCSKSKIFKAHNAWVLALLRLLLELYLFADLKLNLKFEFEVLCKSLNLTWKQGTRLYCTLHNELKRIEPTNLLNEKLQRLAGAQVSSATSETEKTASTQNLVFSSSAPTIQNLTGQFAPPTPGGLPASVLPHGQSALSAEVITGMLVPNLALYVNINPNLVLFNQQPALKRVVSLAIDRAVRDIVTPVVGRSVSISCVATRELVLKDFAMESDEQKMRKAAHLMVQNLAGNLALVTCREPLRASMTNHLRGFFEQQNVDSDLVEDAIEIIIPENIDLACSIIEKAANEKAVTEIDEALSVAFNTRRKHRERTGQPYFDMSIFTSSPYPSTLPEPLRPKPGGLQPHQLRIYADFARVMRTPEVERAMLGMRGLSIQAATASKDFTSHAYQPSTEELQAQQQQRQHMLSTQQCAEIFNQLLLEVDKLVAMTEAHSSAPSQSHTLFSLPVNHELHALLRQMIVLCTQAFNPEEAAIILAQRALHSMFRCSSNLGKEARLFLLERLNEMSKKVQNEIVASVAYLDEEKNFNVDAVLSLLRVRLLNPVEFDLHLTKLLESGRLTSIDFVIQILMRSLLEDPPCVTQSDFFNTIDTINKLSQMAKVPESVIIFLDQLRSNFGRESKDDRNMALKMAASEELFNEQVMVLIDEWLRLCYMPQQSEKAFLAFIAQMRQQGLSKNEDLMVHMIRQFTKFGVDAFLKYATATLNKSTTGASPLLSPLLGYQAVDAMTRLIVFLIKYHMDPSGGNNHALAKINLLNKILHNICVLLATTHDRMKLQFPQKPFYRIFANLLADLNAPDQILDLLQFQILTSFSQALFNINPNSLPGFGFAWLDLISHRSFMPRLLNAKHQKGWSIYQRLLISSLRFLGSYMTTTEQTEPARLYYRGVLRVLVVLLHDAPEFLADYHFSFCDVIPSSCVQLRNLIISAFPAGMRLPDPMTPNLKVDLLPEIAQPPRILSSYTNALLAGNFKQEIDTYLKTRGPVSFLLDLRNRLLLSPQEAFISNTRYNISVINALVLYVGVQAIAQLQNKNQQSTSPMTHSAPMDIYQQLVVDLDPEGRYHFLNAITNQLRYPNSHTHYFSCVLLYLFAEANQEVIREQITRVLVERLVVNRPHPWGLLITFIELIKNQRYNFWSHEFTRCAPEIQKLFDCVARSCMLPSKPATSQGGSESSMT